MQTMDAKILDKLKGLEIDLVKSVTVELKRPTYVEEWTDRKHLEMSNW